MKKNFADTFNDFEDSKPEAIFEAVRVYCLRIAYDWEMGSDFIEHCECRNRTTKALTRLSLHLLSTLNHRLKAVHKLLKNCVLCSVAIDEIDSLIVALTYVEDRNFGCALYSAYYHGLSLSIETVSKALDDFWECKEVGQALQGDAV